VGIDLDGAAEAAVELYADSNERYDEYVKRSIDENADRVDLQLAALGRHLDNQVRKLDDIQQRLLFAGRRSLARATQGRIARLRERVDIRRARIEVGRDVRARGDLICVGILEVV
jgi:hypothetical protein